MASWMALMISSLPVLLNRRTTIPPPSGDKHERRRTTCDQRRTTVPCKVEWGAGIGLLTGITAEREQQTDHIRSRGTDGDHQTALPVLGLQLQSIHAERKREGEREREREAQPVIFSTETQAARRSNSHEAGQEARAPYVDVCTQVVEKQPGLR
jgi:hypothetical protein